MASNIHLQRTPVVAVMGHVDHGKTTLLDTIRGTKVQASEAGGITQNTRAHQIVFQGQKISFIDTPGHEAFSNMRSRGAKVTDIVLLVVAADDGVQPQTKESIDFAKQQNVPVIVALNKIDVPGKNILKLKQELTTAGLLLEEYGGDVMLVEISALKGTNIDELLERVLLLAEMHEFKPEATHGINGRAFVLESTLDNKRGPVALVINKAGKISIGDYIVRKDSFYKIRQLLDSEQQLIETCEQSDPVWIIGMDDVATSGEMLEVVDSEKAAKELIKKFKDAEREALAVRSEGGEISDLDLLSSLLSADAHEQAIKFVNVVVKTDAQGTLEAVREQLESLNDEQVQVKILKAATGNINEEDVLIAKASRGIVIGFQVDVEKRVEEVARKERVLIRRYEIIYTLIGELADVMDSLLEPEEQEVEVARATVKKVFTLTNGQVVAGSEVTKGNFIRGTKVYVLRGENRIADGKVTSLRQLKSEVKEVKKGTECGILIDPAQTLETGDVIVSFKVEKL